MLLSKSVRGLEFCPRLLAALRHCHSRSGPALTEQRSHTEPAAEFFPERALLLRKVTRYEYEKHLFNKTQSDKEEDLENYLTSKGSDYKGLVQRHDEYFRSLDAIKKALDERSIKYQLVSRFEYATELINWADVILTAGGDGTFLNGASKVHGRGTPVIGINTDSHRSEGFLCLPGEYSNNVGSALDKLSKKEYEWMYRQRIRLTMSGKHANDDPVNIHDQQLLYPEHRFFEHVQEHEMHINKALVMEDRSPRVLPILALNDVFIAETLSARVSFYEMSVDGSPPVKQKSSGVTVSTGTGSTSWFFSINQLPVMSVKEILKIIKSMSHCETDVENQELLERITQEFNTSLRFDPTERSMAYCIRDPIINRVFFLDRPRGFCQKMLIKSRMFDACVVVDGGMSFTFNDGAILEMEMFEEDALRTVLIK